MILTPIRRYGAMILMLLTLVFSSEVLAKTHTTTAIVQRVVHFLICENTLPEHQGKRRFSGP